MKKQNDEKDMPLDNHYPPLEKQKPTTCKRGTKVKLVMFDDDDEAHIDEFVISKYKRGAVEHDSRRGDLQKFIAVLKPVNQEIKVDGRKTIEVPAEYDFLTSSEFQAVCIALRGFRYECPEEKLLKAIFDEPNHTEARLRSLILLAAKITKATNREFYKNYKELIQNKKGNK